ncbi:MAG: MobB mobilization protein [Proteobacteria bacterium]|nr:MobB mobilization protein [Pseudomonadota bacterium]
MAPKRGRPRRGEEENRTAQVNVRLTIAEQEDLRQEADSAGLSIGDFVRRRVIGRPVAAHVDRAMINELRRLGGLLKLVHGESKGSYRAETRDTILAIQAAITRVGISDQ